MIAQICLAGLFGFTENIGTIQAILFIAGLILLFSEMFTPGLGVSGIAGTILLIAGIILTAKTPLEAVIMTLILLLLLALLLFLLLRSAKKGKLSKILILRQAMTKDRGFSSTEDNSALVGKEGTAVSQLRPSGIGEFDGRRMDVVSEGQFIEAGSKITVIRAEGRRVVVSQLK